MKKLLLKPMVFVLAISMIFTACKKDEGEEQPTIGTISGVVSDLETSLALADVRILVFDANTNSPVGETYTTNTEGKYLIELEAGTYYLKLYRLGYESIPRPGMTAVPVSVELGIELTVDYQMSPSAVTNGAVISGNVTAAGAGVGGVLVVAEGAEAAYSSVTDAQGNYFIYNVPAGSYTVKGWLATYNSDEQSATAEANAETTDVNLLLTQDAIANVSGTISFLATENTEVDVALVHPLTKETVPGLSTKTELGNYIIENVPDGIYIGRASYENDGLVLDPDWIVKNGGDPVVEVAGGDVILDYSVTGAVSPMSPTNDSTSTKPVEVSIDTLNFTWVPYPSSSDYVIEVMDANGNLIWGGFSADWSQKNVVIPSSQTSITFDEDGTATAQLEVGKTYRWKIYASRDDKQSATGWRLISVSEDQKGLIKIVQ